MRVKSRDRLREVTISEFKAKSVALLNQVNRTKTPIVITRRGVPVAQIVPVAAQRERNWLGSMAGTAKITGDIVSPVIDLNDIEALKD